MNTSQSQVSLGSLCKMSLHMQTTRWERTPPRAVFGSQLLGPEWANKPCTHTVCSTASDTVHRNSCNAGATAQPRDLGGGNPQNKVGVWGAAAPQGLKPIWDKQEANRPRPMLVNLFFYPLGRATVAERPSRTAAATCPAGVVCNVYAPLSRASKRPGWGREAV